GTAGVGAAGLGSWHILGVRGAAYAALVGWDLASPDFWKKTFAGGKDAPALPDPKSLADPELAHSVAALVDARAAVADVLRDTSDDIRANLAGTLAQLGELERHAAGLAVRGQTLAT